MEETTWEQKLQALTHIPTHPNPPLPTLHLLSNPLLPQLGLPTSYLPHHHHLPSPTPQMGSLSLFLERVSRFGLLHTSWRSKCPYQQPPPLVLAKGVEEAHWSDEEKKREYVQKRIRRRPVSDVPPLIPFLVPNSLSCFGTHFPSINPENSLLSSL